MIKMMFFLTRIMTITLMIQESEGVAATIRRCCGMKWRKRHVTSFYFRGHELDIQSRMVWIRHKATQDVHGCFLLSPFTPLFWRSTLSDTQIVREDSMLAQSPAKENFMTRCGFFGVRCWNFCTYLPLLANIKCFFAGTLSQLLVV